MTTEWEQKYDKRWEESRSLRLDTWDKSADDWDRKYRVDGIRKIQGEARIRDTVTYLKERGVLTRETSVADIGCGPGRFTAAFAREGQFALGTDISPNMVQHGEAYCREQGLDNTAFAAVDFQQADLAALGWEGQFDLAFASLTPAVRGLEGLRKLMAVSRRWCFNASLIFDQNDLCDAIAKEALGLPGGGERTSHSYWFKELLLTLLEEGYCPETRYYRQVREMPREADRSNAERLADRIVGGMGASDEQKESVFRWLEAHAGEDGTVPESSDCLQGWILWDKTRRIR